MRVEIIEDAAVAAASAVWASNGQRTIIVLDPALPEVEKLALIKELTEE